MLNWDDLRHLVALAEEGSLSAAARRLKVEHATVARRIAALEQEIGAKLVDRRGGRYELTGAGRSAVGHARLMAEAALSVERLGLGGGAYPVAEISVTAPPTIASELIVPRLPAFQESEKQLRLRLVAASRNLSLNRREADIALRLSRPDVPTLIVRKAGDLDYGLFATGDYLADHHHEAAWQFIGLDEDLADAPQQIWLDGIARSRATIFRSNDLTLQCAAVRAGMGVAALPIFLAQANGFRQVRDELWMSREIWLTYHHDLKASPGVAAVTEFLIACLPASRNSI
ncbi:MAG: LysR family transcriptional regulator [Devosia sp.]